MSVVRRINIVDFKEVEVEIPIAPNGTLRRFSDYEVIDPSKSLQALSLGIIPNLSDKPIRKEFSTWGYDDWGFRINGKEILPDDTQDSNRDGIPDYLSLDITNDGVIDGQDGFGSQDFVGVIKRTFLLAKIRYVDYSDLYKTVNQVYDDASKGIIPNYFESTLNGWLVIGESKPSFYYEQCGTSYGSDFYFGRIPVSINYFDLDDIWIDENNDGSWNLVSGEGVNPLEQVGRFNVNDVNPVMSRNGFDWNFGPDLQNMTNPLQIKFIQQYIPFVVNDFGQPLFPNLIGNTTNLATIKTKISPVNLHVASRFDIINNRQPMNQTGFSDRPFNSLYYELFPEIPERIEFRDGAKKRWGTPRHAIQRGFVLKGTKYTGKCIPVPDEVEDNAPVTGQKRTLVTIQDVLSGKVKMDGTNYIKGVVTAHFTFPIISATLQDIADIYYAYYDQSKLGVKLPYSEFSLYDEKFYVSDSLTFAREMRSVIYIQDETAGMELLGTDFYSTEGLEYQTAPGQFVVEGRVFSGIRGLFDKVKSIDDALAKSSDEYLFPPELRTTSIASFNVEGAPAGSQYQTLSGYIPIKEYWETDTGFLPSRYHIKVGDFVEVYNLNVLRRTYAPRSCKIVNNEYKVIPNDTEDVMKFFEDNGYIKEVSIEKLYSDAISGLNSPRGKSWFDYDYSDENSIHKTEHCLIRVKNVAFANTSRDLEGQSLLTKNNPVSPYRNDQNPSVFPGKTTATKFDDYGYRFEPGRKYVIFDATPPVPRFNITGRSRIFLYNAASTEMSKYLLNIPGRNTPDLLSSEYKKWLSEKRKFDPSGSKYVDYKWPLDIVGIQKFAFQHDTMRHYSYMIMPRSMADFGITSNNYDALRGLRDDPDITSGGGTPPPPPPPPGGGSGGSSSGGSKATCFQKGTNVLTPDGYVSIEEIKVGDLVVTFDENLNLYERPVTRTYLHDKNESSDIYRYTFENGVSLNVTENHPFLTENMKFVHIGDLSIGDSVMTKEKTPVRIVLKEFIKNEAVYNIEVSEFNAFIVENICVHNLTKNAPKLNPIVDDERPI